MDPFRIRPEQVDAFAAARLDDFGARLAAHLRDEFPDRLDRLTPAEVRDLTRECVDRAGGFGLTSERAVACFAHVVVLLDPDVETDPEWRPLADLLRDPRYHPDYRAELAMELAHDLARAGGPG